MAVIYVKEQGTLIRKSGGRIAVWLNPIHSQNYVRMEAAESWQ